MIHQMGHNAKGEKIFSELDCRCKEVAIWSGHKAVSYQKFSSFANAKAWFEETKKAPIFSSEEDAKTWLSYYGRFSEKVERIEA